MKKAFTLLELIFVIVVAGILAVAVIPRLNETSSVEEAAIQLALDIRYLQHLAIQDNRLDTDDTNWFKKRWQLKFSKTVGSDNQWAYAIFADESVDGNPNNSEVAINPQNRLKILTGGHSAGTTAYGDAKATKRLNVGHQYGVSSITMTGGCNISDDGKKRLSFDFSGRPLYGPLHTSSVKEPYQSDFLLKSTCVITLSDGSDSVDVLVEPETGYVHLN